MESKILAAIGIDPAIILIVMFILIIVLFIMLMNVSLKYERLRYSYQSFMRGRDVKNMEDAILDKFDELDEISEVSSRIRQENIKLREDILDCYQKVGILRYDAFNEMGGKLSFVLTLLDGNNNGFILNSMHSREGCYNYIKEIVKGESYIELSEEETESLERAIYQETLGLDLENMK